MNPFVFYMPTKVFFGKGQIAKLGGALPPNKKILITYGGGSVLANGVMGQVKAALSGFDFVEFGGIEPNPAFETLIKAVEVCKTQSIGFILSVGGGSVLDGSKFIAAAAEYDGDMWQMVTSKGAGIKGAIPLGCVLTLPATGSEMNDSSVISRYETGDKISFYSEFVIPRFAVLDPETTFSLPSRQAANGIVDTYVHVCEQYMTYPAGAALTDRLAESILSTLHEQGPLAMANSNDYTSRANIMWCATMGLNDLLQNGQPQDWVTHAMGHEMTAAYGLDHARTLAIVMPSLWDYCRESKGDKLVQYAARVLGITDGTRDEIIDAAIAKVRGFFASLGMPGYFSDLGLDAEKIPHMVKKLREHGKVNIGERGTMSPEDMERIYKMCL